ncbi:hypothetical protein ACPA5B_21845 [Pseudomonas solani]|uniref:hypothetical protein n=1 Tax=Pseudomonas solani TaxID=2731552 RepID=UPI003C2B29CA
MKRLWVIALMVMLSGCSTLKDYKGPYLFSRLDTDVRVFVKYGDGVEGTFILHKCEGAVIGGLSDTPVTGISIMKGEQRLALLLEGELNALSTEQANAGIDYTRIFISSNGASSDDPGGC